MKKADRFNAELGDTMRDSVGVHVDPAQRAGGLPTAPPLTDRFAGLQRIKGAMLIPLGRLTPDPDQPRKDFDPEAMARLAGSLKRLGQLEPARVRWDAKLAKWVVVVGERRYRAAIMAGLETLACVEDSAETSADERLEKQLAENCLREDLRPIEQARAFAALMDRRGWNYRQLAEYLHVGLASVSRAMALLGLPVEIQDQVDSGAIPASTAAELAKVDDPDRQASLAAQAVAGATREQVRRSAEGKPKPTRAVYEADGWKVVITGPPEGSHDQVIAALEKALKKAKGERRTSAAA